MRTYTSTFMVKGEDLNHHGTLFGARAAAWFVEAGLLAAAKEHGHPDEIVMRNILDMSFCRPVENGTMLDFEARVVFAGTTSLVVGIVGKNAFTGEISIRGFISYVTVHAGIKGKKAHGIVLDETRDPEELLQREQAADLLKARK